MNKLLTVGILLFNTLLFGVNYVTYEDALKIANEENKTIMIKITAKECKFCIRMDKKVMVEEEVISALAKDFVSVEIDVNKDKIPLDLNRTMTPTFVFVNKEEEIIRKIAGSWGKEDFLDILKYIVKKSKKEKGESL